MKKLTEIKTGKSIEIVDFEDNSTKCNTARFGLAKGQIIKCIAKLGPIIVSKNHQMIAIGKNLSSKIIVREV